MEPAYRTHQTREDTRSGSLALRGIFRTLISEHRDLVELARRCAVTSEPRLRSQLFPKLRVSLFQHEHGEMTVLYPELESRGLTYGIARRHETSARKLEVVVACLSGYSFDNPRWAETSGTLLEIIQQHVDDEESSFFALAQEAIGGERAEELDERFQAFKAKGAQWGEGRR